MEAKLLLIPWMASVLYSSIPFFWFAIHPFAGAWQRKHRSPYRLLLPIWATVIFALAVTTWPFHSLKLYYPPHSWWQVSVGLAGFMAGLSLRTYWKIHSGFGTRNFIGATELRPQQDPALVTSGMHAQMRHPIYVAHLLMLAAWATGSGLLVPCVLLSVSLVITFPLMIWAEERELVQRFGVLYLEYRKRVPAIAMPLFTHASGKRLA
jgi:protein-S-isoprenylcysteine O-methyltransferase Ste14